MTEEDEWKKLSSDQKCQHKSWKARAEGYKECIKNFAMWDEGSPEFNKYLGLVKKFVTDSNELVRIQGVEATLIFVENANVAKKTCGEVVAGIILKCFNTKPRLKESAIDICLMYIEIDRNEQTMEELVKGFSNKQPKVATACLEAAAKALSLFGSKVIQVKPLLKEIPALADHRDKNVREAAKSLAVEIYKWVGPAIKTSLQNLNPVMLKELEEEWAKADSSTKPTQTRFMRSQQDLREKMEAKAAAAVEGGDGSAAVEVEEQPEVDPYDLLDPVEILSKLPKKIYEQIEAKKWQERKEMLEACQKLCETPKIEPGDFGDLVKALKKVVSKDTNVMLVTIAAKCLAGLANGIRKKFHPFANSCTDAIFEKFKEKKLTVVTALQEAADAIYLSTSLQALSETCIEYLESKNPAIREQVALYLARALAKTKSSTLNKATIRPLVHALLKNIDHSAPTVRDAAYNAMGTLLKLCGDKIVMPFLVDLDNLKLDKIKEYAGKAEVKGKGGVAAAKPAAKAPEPAQAAAKTVPSKAASGKTGDGKKKVVKGGKKPAPKNDTKQPETKPQEPVLSDVAVEDQMADFTSAEVIAQLANNNWKERLEGLQSLSQKLKLSDVKSIPCQAILKTLGSGKQGWKDTNFNCLNEKFAIVKNLAENASFSKTSAEVCIPGLIEKIGDVKCGKASKEAISAVAEATEFSWVSEMLLDIAMAHKNPKIQSESLTWLGDAIKEFGLAGANIKLFIAKTKIGFSATNPAVRSAAVNVIGIMTLYIGAKIRVFFENEKPAILQQIDAEIEKCKGQSPPAPTRGGKSKQDAESDAEDGDEAAAEIKVEDLVSRVNIADKITDELTTKLSDKNWKIRKEGLEEVTTILNEAKFVEPNIGELATAMKARLSDSNKILIATSLSILSQLSVALGPHCKVHVKTVAPGLVGVLADSKPNVRQASLNAMNQWLENTNLSVWFEDEIMSSALSVPKHTFLRIELLNWLAEKLLATPKLTTSAKEGLEACVKHIYACCEDRMGDVRAKAQAVLPAVIYHLGMDKMVRLCGKLSATSVSTVQGLLEKAKEHVPARKGKSSAKPKSAAPSPAPIDVDIDVPVTEPEKGETKTAAKPKSNAKQSKLVKRPGTSKKQSDEPESGPALIKILNGKEQRMREEQKLKTLKWAFDAPREELITQLKTQLTPCVGSSLATELFHADFQHHIKAITILSQALEQQWEETIGTLDLILRWVTLRFYEKNTSVHMKCLDYLKNLFSKLSDDGYKMSDYEANGFIPHLITKIGEPKENIRKDVHAIVHRLNLVYPAGKIFTHLMQGLATKNSRQKTECLDDIGQLITSHGIDVCQPTAPKALREIATHIGDRDNSVRSAALNVIVCAYNNCGDVVYKYVGKLNEKNMSMLEERIKRSGKFGVEPVAAAAPAKSEPRGLKLPSKSGIVEKSKISTSDLHSSGMSGGKKHEQTGIDESLYKLPELLPTDMADDFIDEPDMEIPPKFVTSLAEYRSRGSNATVDAILNNLISTLASDDIDECIKSIHQIDEIMKHDDKRELLKPRIDQILTSSCIQIRMAMNRYVGDDDQDTELDGGDANQRIMKVQSLFKCIFAVNLNIAKSSDLALCASQNPLQDFIHAVNLFTLDKKVKEKIPNSGRLISALGMLIKGLFTNANSTYMTCAVLQNLFSSLESNADEQRDFALRCLWNVAHQLRSFIKPPEDSSKPPLMPAPVMAEFHKLCIAVSSMHSVERNEEKMRLLRTIRIMIKDFCEAYGIRILDEIQDIEGIASSELLRLVTKTLKTKYSAEEIESHPVIQGLAHSSNEKKENIDMENSDVSPEKKLSSIVKKVGNFELTKQGLQELYDFKQQYPDYDVESKFNNPLFLSYIRRSLQTIDQERKSGIVSSYNVLKSSDMNQRYTDRTPNEHLEHIKMLRMRCGLPVDSVSLSKVENKVKAASSHRNNSDNQRSATDRDKELHAPVTTVAGVQTTSGTDVQSSSLPVGASGSRIPSARSANTSNMESLKERLDKIKRDWKIRK